MGTFSFIILGLIAGAIAKAILLDVTGLVRYAPARCHRAVVGGWLNQVSLMHRSKSSGRCKGWALAIGGLIVVLLLIWGLLTGRKKTHNDVHASRVHA